MKSQRIPAYLICFLFLISCNTKGPHNKNISTFEISDFSPLSNYTASSTDSSKEGLQTKLLYFDYTDAIDSGFVAPTVRQTKEGVFISKFKIENKSGKSQR